MLRLGDFDDREAAFLAQLAGPQNAGVRAFDRFDGDHGAVLDANALADIETTHLLGDLPTKLDVLLLCGRRRPAGDLSLFHKKLRSEIGGGMKFDSLGGKGVGQRAEQRIILIVARMGDEVVDKTF